MVLSLQDFVRARLCKIAAAEALYHRHNFRKVIVKQRGIRDYVLTDVISWHLHLHWQWASQGWCDGSG
jgi:hypothetical protein